MADGYRRWPAAARGTALSWYFFSYRGEQHVPIKGPGASLWVSVGIALTHRGGDRVGRAYIPGPVTGPHWVVRGECWCMTGRRATTGVVGEAGRGGAGTTSGAGA